MTTVHPDLAALLAAVCQFPHDDTPRLVLADCLDEHGQHERAEFIRAQIAAARGESLPGLKLWELLHGSEWFADLCKAFGFESRHWGVYPDETVEYQHKNCDGSFCVRRGFVETVRCRMGDVLREQYEGHAAGLPVDPDDRLNSREWALTPWARGVLAAHPVTRWEITDREPSPCLDGTQYAWHVGNSEPWELPDVVYMECSDIYDSAELARDALALAVGRVARQKWEEEVTP